MASGSGTPEFSHPSLPVFKGDGYERWSVKMMTLFQSLDLWSVVEQGSLKEGIDEQKKEMAVKRHTLGQKFDVLQMRENEDIQQYVSRVISLVNQFKGLRYDLEEKEVVAKVMRSVIPKFDNVITTIEEARDLDKLIFSELSGGLQAYEARFDRFSDSAADDKVFYMKGESSSGADSEGYRGRRFSRARGRFMRGRGRSFSEGRGRSNFHHDYRQYQQQQFNSNLRDFGSPRHGGRQYGGQKSGRGMFRNVQFFNCGKFGHMKSHCWHQGPSSRNEQGSSSRSDQGSSEAGRLFMVHEGMEVNHTDIWLLDSRASNHMTGRKNFFHQLDELIMHTVRLGDDKEVAVKGKVQRNGNNLYPVVFSEVDLANIVISACVYGKQTRLPFGSGTTWRARGRLQMVHADVCGPMQIESHGERQTVEKLRTIRTDKGGEFLSREFEAFCENLGIRHELTAPYTPQQNGLAERKNRVLIEKARCILKFSKLPNEFWTEAVLTAAYISNISPTKAIFNKTPFESWFGLKPKIHHLRTFGCIAYPHMQKVQKLDDRAVKGILIRYAYAAKAYRIYIPSSKKVIISRDVTFAENHYKKLLN
ncbi:uncharacterized protein LOC120265009 [Dioscorea cayenensis subsp. rotundata]|uniref:Uncharacterized protein LOC120265009 n=1 Tax=Dioscorea cayennensis subsp. rotundata TaxID=55577 RepID=A0AB40BR39_DIOCR|nr:uncharacterized protein LOC120265009 [Dioscorea cayenensis subsp. rotundata]